MNLRLKRTPGLYLVGFMGSGKSTVGRALADRLGWRFVDLDTEIEAAERTSIERIFADRGEPEFRRIEAEVLRKQVRSIEAGRPAVIALGGGAFVARANYDLCQANGISIWLDISLDRARQRVSANEERPLARDPQRFLALYQERRAAYSLADYRVGIDSDDPDAAVEAILKLPLWNVR